MASTYPALTEEQIEYYEQIKIETRDIIKNLLDDGSLPDALYLIEHHFASDDFEQLENLAVEAFKLDFEVTDAEELEDENGEVFFACDVVCEMNLVAEKIDEQVELMIKLAGKFNCEYDGWGTYFEDGSDEDDGVIFDDE
ncbi:ribonuclease E inhibitor RraB [Thorsellia anophelis]|uniref:Regulator of ribonuclease activity B n=1 Tax=Thorsellia anophelis DSM 18579 TaxID=1123402 RepID=A0A1I0CAM9_9GAMM|nr:ribonuclease E inhibitor RraB [Thorsellia anophelis]SET16465.1 hypothetical protein SAMN02583745_01547 [Thorsellia anophelis DSM 18579]